MVCTILITSYSRTFVLTYVHKVQMEQKDMVMYPLACGGPVNAHVSKIICFSTKGERTTQPLWPLWPNFPLVSQPSVLHGAQPTLPP